MFSFISKRLVLLIPTILGIVTLTFFAVRLGGVSPALIKFPKAKASEIAEIEKANGWDKPLVVQYVDYLGKLSRFDLGDTLIGSTRSVADELKERLPATIELALTALLLAIVIGVPIGIMAALKPNTWVDYTAMTGALAGISIPVFWLAMLLVLAFGDILPFSGRLDSKLKVIYQFKTVSNFMLWDTFFYSDKWILFWDAIRHLILPATALATIPMAVIARITRSSMLDVIKEDYVRTARSKGLSPFCVVYKHALKNALPQINTVIGLQTGMLLSGAILTESIFSWNGIGSYVLSAAQNRDYYAIQGSVILLALIFVISNLLVDLSYGFFDPRVRVQ